MAERSKHTLRSGVALGGGAGVLGLLGALLSGMRGLARGVLMLLGVIRGSDVATLDQHGLAELCLLVACSALI